MPASWRPLSHRPFRSSGEVAAARHGPASGGLGDCYLYQCFLWVFFAMLVLVVCECFFAKAAGGEKISAVAIARAMVRTLFFIFQFSFAGFVRPDQIPSVAMDGAKNYAASEGQIPRPMNTYRDAQLQDLRETATYSIQWSPYFYAFNGHSIVQTRVSR